MYIGNECLMFSYKLVYSQSEQQLAKGFVLESLRNELWKYCHKESWDLNRVGWNSLFSYRTGLDGTRGGYGNLILRVPVCLTDRVCPVTI